MPERAMIYWTPIWSGVISSFERHPATVGILVLALIFLSGLLEAVVFRRRGPACATFGKQGQATFHSSHDDRQNTTSKTSGEPGCASNNCNCHFGSVVLFP